jgi:hypothetical protein
MFELQFAARHLCAHHRMIMEAALPFPVEVFRIGLVCCEGIDKTGFLAHRVGSILTCPAHPQIRKAMAKPPRPNGRLHAKIVDSP